METLIDILSQIEKVGHQADKDEGGATQLPLEDKTLDEEGEELLGELDFND